MRVASLAVFAGLHAVGTLAVGCSSNSAAAGGADDAGASTQGLVSCDDPRVQNYSANMQQPGASGTFTFVLVSSSPAPPADESNTLVVKVLDSTGAPVTGATLDVLPTMPLMSHGTSTVTVTPNSDGTYTLQPVYLFMAGLWEIAISATSGSQKDSTSFYFCVSG